MDGLPPGKQTHCNFKTTEESCSSWGRGFRKGSSTADRPVSLASIRQWPLDNPSRWCRLISSIIRKATTFAFACHPSDPSACLSARKHPAFLLGSVGPFTLSACPSDGKHRTLSACLCAGKRRTLSAHLSAGKHWKASDPFCCWEAFCLPFCWEAPDPFCLPFCSKASDPRTLSAEKHRTLFCWEASDPFCWEGSVGPLLLGSTGLFLLPFWGEASDPFCWDASGPFCLPFCREAPDPFAHLSAGKHLGLSACLSVGSALPPCCPLHGPLCSAFPLATWPAGPAAALPLPFPLLKHLVSARLFPRRGRPFCLPFATHDLPRRALTTGSYK